MAGSISESSLNLLYEKHILDSLNICSHETLSRRFHLSSPIRYLVFDDLLPADIFNSVASSFPSRSEMYFLSQYQERKYTAVKFSDSAAPVEALLYSFQSKNIIDTISRITSIPSLQGDPSLYAGGISSMTAGCFLKPHIDNSHNRQRTLYRRLNLLYYCTPKNQYFPNTGGELVLYPHGLSNISAVTIAPLPNRLVIMETNQRSFHAVNLVISSAAVRNCVSNYYFSLESPSDLEYSHSTSFYPYPSSLGLSYIPHRIGSFIRHSSSVLLSPVNQRLNRRRTRV
jgi:Rps23 Pro-64 3,4-dihydroxylase Tpa1-like proline 4-hydroxylase